MQGIQARRREPRRTAAARSLRVELAPIRPAGAGFRRASPGPSSSGASASRSRSRTSSPRRDKEFVDDKAGIGWGNRCYTHFKNGLLPYARAACQKALESEPAPKTKGAVLYNVGLIEEASGDARGGVSGVSRLARVQAGCRRGEPEVRRADVPRRALEVAAA